MANISLIGKHPRLTRKKIDLGSGTLLIAERPTGKTTRAKTPHYILHIDPDGNRNYISSLWQVSGMMYAFEYGGIRYNIQFTPTHATIAQSNSVVYQSELFRKIRTT